MEWEKGRKGERRKGWTPVPDWEIAKVATLEERLACKN